MSGPHDLELTLPWMREGTARFLAAVGELTDDDFKAPSKLPQWSRAHVVGHLAHNAEALGRLAAWARTGVENPMYASRDQRAAEIAESATLPASELRSRVAATAGDLDDALLRLGTGQWNAQVRSALGRAIPAAEIPWLRVREVWLHAIDLDNGVSVVDLPSGVVDALLDDVTAALSRKDTCPALVLSPTDRRGTWRIGAAQADDSGSTAELRATAADTMGWLTGRIPSSALRQELPVLPSWL